MPCIELKDKLDDYVDDLLPTGEAERLDAHVAGCASCKAAIGREHKLRELLKNYGDTVVEQPDEAWFDAALSAAAGDGRRERRNRWLTTAVAAAFVASIAVWIVASTVETPPLTADNALPMVTMTVAEPRRINLLFAAASDLPDAEVTLLLPPGVSLAGFEGQREVRWTTSLKAGRNLLPLTLIGSMPGSGELEAILEHGEDDRRFRVRVSVI